MNYLNVVRATVLTNCEADRYLRVKLRNDDIWPDTLTLDERPFVPSLNHIYLEVLDEVLVDVEDMYSPMIIGKYQNEACIKNYQKLTSETDPHPMLFYAKYEDGLKVSDDGTRDDSSVSKRTYIAGYVDHGKFYIVEKTSDKDGKKSKTTTLSFNDTGHKVETMFEDDQVTDTIDCTNAGITMDYKDDKNKVETYINHTKNGIVLAYKKNNKFKSAVTVTSKVEATLYDDSGNGSAWIGCDGKWATINTASGTSIQLQDRNIQLTPASGANISIGGGSTTQVSINATSVRINEHLIVS